MRITVLKEVVPGETRVALVPESVGRLVKAGHEVVVEQGAGVLAAVPDSAYQAAGAKIADSAAAALDGAALVLKVQRPGADEIAQLPSGSAILSFMAPASAAQAKPVTRYVEAKCRMAIPRSVGQ